MEVTDLMEQMASSTFSWRMLCAECSLADTFCSWVPSVTPPERTLWVNCVYRMRTIPPLCQGSILMLLITSTSTLCMSLLRTLIELSRTHFRTAALLTLESTYCCSDGQMMISEFKLNYLFSDVFWTVNSTLPLKHGIYQVHAQRLSCSGSFTIFNLRIKARLSYL